MFFNNQKDEELQEAPLGYWEEASYMMIIPDIPFKNPLIGLFERIAEIPGVTILEEKELGEEEPGSVKVNYENDEYEIGFFPSSFSLQGIYMQTIYHFEEKEIEKLKNVDKSLTIYMNCQNKDAKKAYHLQLKIAYAIIPEMLALLDESAERMIPARWVKMAAESNIVPAPSDMFTVQAVSEKNGEVWLHTHGLCRFGLTELEILQSDKEHYKDHYNLIANFASYLIDNKDDFNPLEECAYIGVLNDRSPIVVTCLSWTKALKEYSNLDLGGIKDRENGHNSKTSVIFIYKNDQDERNKELSKISIYNELWGDNTIFFLSNEETARMKALAIERFNFVKEQFENKENKVILKINLVTDDGESGGLEHIWFELLNFEGEKFNVKLLQEPYNVANVHEGDEMCFAVEDITDWIIYTPKATITPSNVYLLLENEEEI